MKKTWQDRLVVYWWGIKQPYDEHARAEVGRISTIALLFLVLVEFVLLMSLTFFDQQWLDFVALLVLVAAMQWVAMGIKKAGLTTIEATTNEMSTVLKQLKWESIRRGLVFGVVIAAMIVLLDASKGDFFWTDSLWLGGVTGLVYMVTNYYARKGEIKVIDE